MHIFSVNNDDDSCHEIKALDFSQIEALFEHRWQSLEAGWKPISFKWEKDCEGGKPDMLLAIGFVFIVNRKAMELFRDELKINDVEYLPVDIEGEDYYIVNSYGFLSGAVDLDRSSVKYFKDGKVMWIDYYAFHEGVDYPLLFRVPEIKTSLFATDDLVNAVKSNGLKGLKFSICAL